MKIYGQNRTMRLSHPRVSRMAIFKALKSLPCVRVVRSGGSLNNGDQAGFATLNANNTSSNRNSNSGGRVCFSDSDFSALPLGKTHNRPQGVSRHAESSGQKSKHN